MSVVHIDVGGQEALAKAEQMLGFVSDGYIKAMKEASKRATAYIQANSSKLIQMRYDLPVSTISQEGSVTITYRGGSNGGTEAVVKFAGAKIPLYKYGGASPAEPAWDTSRWVKVPIHGKEKWVHPGLPAYGHQLRGTAAKRFNDAFVAQMKSGHIGIFERTGESTSSGSDKIEEIMGSAVAQMVANKSIIEELSNKAAKIYEESLNEAIVDILSGYMG